MTCCPLRELCGHYDSEFCCEWSYETCLIYETIRKVLSKTNLVDYDKVYEVLTNVCDGVMDNERYVRQEGI